MHRSWTIALFLSVMGFVYAQSRADHLVLYYSDDCDIKITPSAGPKIRLERDWSWNPGFKAGLGFNLPHDGWDVFAEYAWIYSDVSNGKSQSATTFALTPYWNVTSMPEGALVRASKSWDVYYNNMTLDLGRNAYLSQYINLRLFADLIVALLWDKFDLDRSDQGTSGGATIRSLKTNISPYAEKPVVDIAARGYI